jgi:hypothetical protein
MVELENHWKQKGQAGQKGQKVLFALFALFASSNFTL